MKARGFICSLLLAAVSMAAASAAVRIVPEPVRIVERAGKASLPSAITISAPSGSGIADTYIDLTSGILEKSGITLEKGGWRSTVKLSLSRKVDGAGAYIIEVRRRRVMITASDEGGLWNGLQTLTQLLIQGVDHKMIIYDAPRFGYRGAMLDCGRHFFTVDEVKAFIDMMAVHKLNRFHWHLTEDQGWRIEIKKYPLLTEIGSVRKGSYLTNYSGEQHDAYSSEPYGGFYTQDEIREVVKYAQDRHIVTIPEIEIPGHSMAALASYPWLGCTGGPYEVRVQWGVSDDVMCIGKESTWEFCRNVLDEVCELFPGELIHIGGDEAPRVRWAECPHCQALMKKEGMTSEAQLQSWITSKVENYLASKGKRIIGWDEVLEGGVSTGCVVMPWANGSTGGQKAAALGNDVIMTDKFHCYFDCYQTESREGELFAHNRNIPLEKVWQYDPVGGMDAASASHVLGVQCNTWTEHISAMDRVYFMNLPRIAALAEVAWSSPESLSGYHDFLERLQASFIPLYSAASWPFAEFYRQDLERR